jgi:hypothetical protein
MKSIFLAANSDLKAPHVEADQVLSNGISLALWGIGILAVAVIIYAAFRIVTARGDVEKVKKGQRAIIWGMVGLGIAVLTGVIVRTVTNIFG